MSSSCAHHFTFFLLLLLPYTILICNGVTVGSPKSWQWQRCGLIYLNFGGPSLEGFRHFVQRMDPSGNYMDQRMFDSVIILPADGDMVITREKLYEKKLTDIAKYMTRAATTLDDVITNATNLTTKEMQVILSLPYFPQQEDMTLDLKSCNKSYRLSVPSERDEAALWFVKKIQETAQSAAWKNLNLWGIYFTKEGADDDQDDPRFLKSINRQIQQKFNFGTVWVPDYDSVNGWRGKEFGFNVTSIQPSYAFWSPIDGSNFHTTRLYSAGHKAAAQGQSFEYEMRWPAQSDHEYQMAHQYLAVSQVTGASKYPQVFYLWYFLWGLTKKADAVGRTWDIYEDLANYLKGDRIPNFDMEIPWQPNKNDALLQEMRWRVPAHFENVNSIRLDFQDDKNNFWRGRLLVQTPKMGNLTQKIVSYSQRTGREYLDPTYQSIYVPLGNLNTAKGSELIIQMTREDSSNAWPKVRRLVAGKLEQPTIANPIFGQISKSSNPNPNLLYTDNVGVDTHVGFKKGGKLTDGRISPLKNDMAWTWSGAMGWPDIFTIVLDLGQIRQVAGVNVVSHYNFKSSIGIPKKMAALVSPHCEPQVRGVVGFSCLATASTGIEKISGGQVAGLTEPGRSSLRNVSLEFATSKIGGQVSARYVTISATNNGWAFIDEIQVLDRTGKVLSQGSPYRVTPMTGYSRGEAPFGDNYGRLLDGNVMADWIEGLRQIGEFDGIKELDGGKEGGHVEAVWGQPMRGVRNAVIWMTKKTPDGSRIRVEMADFVQIQWRNSTLHWQDGTKVFTKADTNFTKFCGLASGVPCVKMELPANAQVTGVRAAFPPRAWFMVTEISVE